MMPGNHRKALAELAAGGLLYVYVDNGYLCRKPAKIGSGVIVGGMCDRMAVSVGTVNALTRSWTQWSEADKAAVIRPGLREIARMIGAGRDLLIVATEGRSYANDAPAHNHPLIALAAAADPNPRCEGFSRSRSGLNAPAASPGNGGRAARRATVGTMPSTAGRKSFRST